MTRATLNEVSGSLMLNASDLLVTFMVSVKTCSLANYCTGHHKDQMVGAGKLFVNSDIKRLLTSTRLKAVFERFEE